MTNDLISREALKKKIESYPVQERTATLIVMLLEAAPAVDTALVVRCNDCTMAKFVFDSQCRNEQIYCNAFKCWVDNDGFCSSGRKRRCGGEH